MNRTALWEQLTATGLVTGELPPPAAPPMPWPVRVMLGFAGWIGALFLLGFAGIAFSALFRSADAAIPAGIVCCAAAAGVFIALPKNDFANQFGLALSLAGQALVMVGLMQMTHDRPHSSTFLAMAIFEAALAAFVPNYIHRAFTTLSANACLFIAAGMLGAPVLATAVAAAGAALPWLFPREMAKQPALWEPLAYGCAIALLHMDGSLLIGTELWKLLRPESQAAPPYVMWLGAVATGAIFVYTAWRLGAKGPILAGAAAVALCGLWVPGVASAMLIITVGFATGRTVLMGLGILAFGGYLSHFYYSLEITLLAKSIALCGTGILLIALRWLLPAVKEETHA